MEAFGEKFKQLRLNNNLTLREFCKQAEIDSSNWSKIERGILPPPKTKDELIRLANIIKLSASDDEFNTLHDLAITESIPKTLVTDEQVLTHLPLFFRTVRGKNPSEEDLKELFNLIKKSNES